MKRILVILLVLIVAISPVAAFATTWLNVTNNATSTLSSTMTAASSSFTVTTGQGALFPSSSFTVTIDSEIIYVSSRSSDNFTVGSRGYEGTTAAAHAIGAAVNLNLTAAVITQIQSAVDNVTTSLSSYIRSDNTTVNTIVSQLSGKTPITTDNTTVNSAITKANAALADNATIQADLAKAAASRTVLTANRTYYVRTDGNDSNTGLANTSAGAFLTIQKAIDAAAALDCSIYDITIQLGAGTYVVTSSINLKSIIGSGSVTIIGDESTPTNVVIDGQGVLTIFQATAVSYTTYKLKGFKLYSSTSNATTGIRSSKGSYIEYQNLNFGSGMTQQVRAEDGGKITCTGNYTISGGAMNHFTGVAGILRVQSVTITLTGTPAFTAFADVSYGSVGILNNCTYSGSATGVRYNVTMNGVCYVGGAGANYFPGDSAGSTSTGGQYN